MALDPDRVVPWLSRAIGGDSLKQPFSLFARLGDDDCAVIDLAGSDLLVLTSDYINAQPIMMTLAIGSYSDLGRYLVNCNLSDLCGSGAEPIAILTSIMWDRNLPESYFEDLMYGARAASDAAEIAIIGGDTKLSSRSAYCATAFGTASTAAHLFLKGRARPGDGIWVSGPVGGCGAAVVGLERKHWSESWRAWARDAIVKPKLPLAASRGASALEMNGAGTDLSDGLGVGVANICLASNVGAEVSAESIPVAPHVEALSREIGVPSYAFGFTVGGDLQFVVCAGDSYSDHLEELNFARIGVIHADPAHMKLVNLDGALVDLPAAGHRDARAMSFGEEVRHLLQIQGYEW